MRERSLPLPRIHTFGVGIYCNHYFLKQLASLSRGLFDVALKPFQIADQIKVMRKPLRSRTRRNSRLNPVDVSPPRAPSHVIALYMGAASDGHTRTPEVAAETEASHCPRRR